VTDEHYAKAAQIAAQPALVSRDCDGQRSSLNAKTPEKSSADVPCLLYSEYQAPPVGLESTSNSSENPGVSVTGGAKSGAFPDNQLNLVVAHWFTLSEDTKATILSIIRNADR